ncbi:MAG: hypothetical protein R3F41_05060 [Gammaproteobacteria bacterium]|nr:hypothetical protein [Pseudomonadales bacterium]MCP5345328.1 hypothetical protein [Pseudomonadales bacterium]
MQMSDLVCGLTKAWQAQGLPESSKAVDVIIHSTGGLIVRDWLHTEFASKSRKPPINNLVMLAPANFGSPLAHKGRAFYGRVLKGIRAEKRFNTGTHILKALEMASEYSWDLADNDRFNNNLFSTTGVRTTVIVGNTGYKGISSIANEPGSDGTVYVATANMNCAKVEMSFPAGNRKPKVKAINESRGDVAFLLVDGANHSSVAHKDDNFPGNTQLIKDIVKALDISNTEGFEVWLAQCAKRTKKVMDINAEDSRDYKHGFQNTVFRVRDDQGFDVQDYVIEFYSNEQEGEDTLAEEFNRRAIRKVHAWGDNAAYRSFLININRLNEVMDKPDEILRISLSAVPDLDDEKNYVGYRTFGDRDIGELELTFDQVRQFFQPNRTLFVDITLTRQQKEGLFWIRNKQDVE